MQRSPWLWIAPCQRKWIYCQRNVIFSSFESNVKSRESWFLSRKMLYFLEARMCYLLKIASWSAWKAAPVWLSPVGWSYLCNMLYCLHVSPKVTCPEASSGQVNLLQYLFLCHMFCLLVTHHGLVLTCLDTLETCLETCAVSCVLSPDMFSCAITFWVGSSLVMFANISVSLHDRAHIIAYGQWCAVKCIWSPVWDVPEGVLFLSEVFLGWCCLC